MHVKINFSKCHELAKTANSFFLQKSWLTTAINEGMVYTAMCDMCQEEKMKTSVYLNKAAEERYKKIKAIEPDYSLTMATDAGLKVKIEQMNAQLTDMTEQIAWKGNQVREGYFGTKVKFFGKKLASVETNQVGPESYEYQTLYLTKKGNYLVQITIEDKSVGDYEYDYEVCYSIKELQEKASPILLTKAGKTPGELLEEIDI